MNDKKICGRSLMLFLLGAFFLCGAKFSPVWEESLVVEVEVLNVRSGPGPEYPVIGTAKKGEHLYVVGMMGDRNWYLVIKADGSTGLVHRDFVSVTAFSEELLYEGDGDEASIPKAESIFNYSNKSRFENGIKNFLWDDKLNRIAALKAQDMAENDYFGHESEKYGTPFKMLKIMGVDYNSASENIAAGNDLEKVYKSLIASPAHRGNILNKRFNKMGVGVWESEKYGYIIVQLFVEE